MKKLALLLMSVVLFTSCDIDDDGVQTMTVLTEVASADLPEYFEPGETVEIEVTYVLPDACHSPAGLDARREANTGEKRRNIIIFGVATYDANRTNCPEEGEDMEKTSSFSIEIDEEEPYIFKLWTGEIDVDDNPIYQEIVVPVGQPEDGDEGEEGEGEGEA